MCPLQALKGPRGLQERPGLSPSKETEEHKDPPGSMAFLDHEVRAVAIETSVRV